MKRSFAPCAAAALLAVSCSSGPLDPLADFVGSWEGTHRVAGDETAHPASYEVRVDGEALIWEFRSAWGGGFTGRGVQLWDAAHGEYVETWTDSMGGEPLAMRGAWDAASSTLTMRAESPDWETGAPITFRHRTVRNDRDRWTYTMIAERAGGPEEVMWIEMRRK